MFRKKLNKIELEELRHTVLETVDEALAIKLDEALAIKLALQPEWEDTKELKKPEPIVVIIEKKDAPQNVKDKVIVNGHTGVQNTYQTVAEWSITENKIGYLEYISIVSSNYAKTLLRLTVDAIQFTDKAIQTTLNIPYNAEIKYKKKHTIKVECKTTDGTTSITVDAMIKGLEER
jgi:hypothetical protein